MERKTFTLKELEDLLITLDGDDYPEAVGDSISLAQLNTNIDAIRWLVDWTKQQQLVHKKSMLKRKLQLETAKRLLGPEKVAEIEAEAERLAKG